MRSLNELETLGNVHRLIKTKRMGSVNSIAKSIDISRSCLYKYIEEIETLGGEVKYSRQFQYFYYLNSFELKITIETNEMNQIYGGKNNFIPYTNYGRKGFKFALSDKSNGCFVYL
jgi:biotin operon repressor